MKKKIWAICALALFVAAGAEAAPVQEAPGVGKTIVYIPQDSRPVNDRQTVAAAEKLGYKVLVPPEELLGRRGDNGHPEELLAWLSENAGGAEAAVVSTDALLYGSLVGSRMHELTTEEIMSRAEKLRQFHASHPRLPLYGFSTVMRTPRGGNYSSFEPAYYQEYGAKIFRYTALLDKEGMGELTRRERREREALKGEIPQEYLMDWLQRRAKNFDANERFLEMAGEGVFSYFLLGCDDSAVPSQTHREARLLERQGENLGKTRAVVTSGADELGMLMMSRAIHDDLRNIPFIYTEYADGKGRDTLPDYTNEKIGLSVDKAIAALGGIPVPDPRRADLVLLVSTDPQGKTFEANAPLNTKKPRRGTKAFLQKVEGYVQAGRPVAVADIAFANGADNALVEGLRAKGLQMRLTGYGGWNTATNTTGFLLGSATLTPYMNKAHIRELLMERYLDDWAYQANIRGQVAGMLGSLPGEGNYGQLDSKMPAAQEKTSQLLLDFMQRNMCFPWGMKVHEVQASFPWNRMFECDIDFRLDPEQ